MSLCSLVLASLSCALAAAPSAQEWGQAGREAHAQGLRDLSLYDYRQALKIQPQPALQAWAEGQAKARRSEPFAATAPGPRSLEDPLPLAVAAWLQGPAPRLAPLVNAHNLAVPKSQQILYAFYPCGEARFDRGQARLLWDPAPAQDLAERIGGEARVLPWVQLKGKDKADWSAVAQGLAAALQRDRRLAGLCLDGPAPALQALLQALRPLSPKPLFAVCEPWDQELIAWADVAVVPLFSRGSQPYEARRFKAQAGARARAGLASARQAGVRCLLGLPASLAPDQGPAFADALEALQGALGLDDPAYLGAALWSLGEGPAVDEGPSPTFRPGAFGPELWTRLKLPLVEP